MSTKKKTFRMKRGPAGDVSLNITAMADIFTVILVFLLKSYASGAMTITPYGAVDLPAASAKSEHVEAVKLEISKDALVIEGEKILDLVDFKFPDADIRGGFSKTTFDALQKIRQRQNAATDNIIIIADRRTPYASLKLILGSAAGNGLTNYKMAVRGLE